MNSASTRNFAISHVAILVPARNEEALIPRCLRSLAVARTRLPSNVTSDVVVVSDGSTDTTFLLAADLVGTKGLVVHVEARNVGIARAVAAQHALTRVSADRRHVWLASTDADCEVPPEWLQHQIALAATGADAVAGIVDVDSFAEHDRHVGECFKQTYMLREDGSHPHVHGCNLGVRADAYLRAGGWSPMETAEDHNLWGRLRSSGARLHSDATLKVMTSGRRVGRAPRGFAAALAAHNSSRGAEG